MRRIVSVMILSAAIGLPFEPGFASSAFSTPFQARPVGQERETRVAGAIEEVGPGFLVISGLRFSIAKNVKVIGKEGMPVKEGVNALRVGGEVEALAEGEVILKIRLVELVK